MKLLKIGSKILKDKPSKDKNLNNHLGQSKP